MFPGGSAHDRDPGIRTVLFTDIVGSTTMTQHLGDDGAMALLFVHDRIVRDALAAARDARSSTRAMGSWPPSYRPPSTLQCAARIQSELAQHRKENSDKPLKVRIGAAAGEPVEHARDLFGSTVQLAARLCSHAQEDQILVSNVVVELCIGKGLPFRDLGDITLRGFDRPVRVHAFDWPGQAERPQ